ncbi:MAG: glycosyl transferase family 9 [Planctomycetota bacterium]|nr:glycosyl transferase family 9 [Planctomycetota bacterium]
MGTVVAPLRRVVIFRALQLGDMLCAVPALRAMRAAWTEAEIVLVGLPWARSFVARFGRYLDGFREFPGYPGLPERPSQIGRIPAFLAAIQAERFDLAIQLHGSGSFVNPLTELFGATRCAGFALPGGYVPDPDLFIPWPERGLEIRRLLELASSLGAPDLGEDLEFPLEQPDFQALDAIDGARELEPGRYVCIHAGASVPERRWPVERFAAVARQLAGHGLRIVLTGTGSESEHLRWASWPDGSLNLTGRTDLGTLGVLIRQARQLVCNDTGVSHIAAALRVPSVVISTGHNPERWAPIDSHRHRVLCHETGVNVEEVVAHAEQLLGSDLSVCERAVQRA